MDYRQAVLTGSRGAAEALDRLGLKARVREGLQQIDVFDALKQLDVTTICRPLDGLLGVYTTNDQNTGILISTKRRLPIQRFTAAHELGHYWLKHGSSVDSEDSINAVRQNRIGADQHEEVEAEAFASAFVMPKALIKYTAQRQNYSKADLKNPDIIYQLSLRLGVSYTAAKVGLLNHRIISSYDFKAIENILPKPIKERLLNEYGMKAKAADVYYLTEKDDGAYFMSTEGDIMILDLPSHTSSGYLWEQIDNGTEFTTMHDFQSDRNTTDVGGVTRLKKVFTGENKSELSMAERRPWENNSAPISQFNITLDFRGGEKGLPRAFRQ